MYEIKLHLTPHHRINAEYTIPGDIIIIRRHSYVDDEWKDVNIGLSVNELLNLAEIINTRKNEHDAGIDPPDSEVMTRKQESYMDDM